MFGQIDTIGKERSDAQGRTWLSRLAVAWIAGILLAAQWPSRFVFAAAALLALSCAVWGVVRRRYTEAHVAGFVAFAFVGGAWFVVQRDYVPSDHVSRVIHDEPAIAGLRGKVASTPREVKANQGSFGGFNYQQPGTLFELQVDAVDVGNGFESASGAVLVRIKQHDHRPKLGQRIEVVGWMSTIGPTQNPGEFDYRAYLQRQGVSGRISLMSKGNWQPLAPPPRWTLTGLRRAVATARHARRRSAAGTARCAAAWPTHRRDGRPQ